jgi:hypothetical protein
MTARLNLTVYRNPIVVEGLKTSFRQLNGKGTGKTLACGFPRHSRPIHSTPLHVAPGNQLCAHRLPIWPHRPYGQTRSGEETPRAKVGLCPDHTLRASSIDQLCNSRRETHLSDRGPTTPNQQRVCVQELRFLSPVGLRGHPVHQRERCKSAESRINLLPGTPLRYCGVDETRDWSFGIVYALGLAPRPRLAGRSPSGQRPEVRVQRPV